MMVKHFLLGGTTYEVIPLQDKFVISAKRYLGFMSLFYFRRAFLGRDETFGTKSDLAKTPANFIFASEGIPIAAYHIQTRA